MRLYIFLVWVLVIGSALPVTGFADQKPHLKIGIILSLSGGLEQFCNPIREGVELALKQNSSIKLEVIYEDDQSINLKAANSAAQKLLFIDKVSVMFTWTGANAPPIIPYAEKAKVPLIVGAYDENVRKGGPWIFGYLVNYPLLAKEHAHFMIKNLGAKRIAIILANDFWSQQFLEPFREEALKLGAHIVLVESIDPNSHDSRSLVLKAKQEHADGIFAPLYGNSLYALVRQAKTIHFDGVIDGADGIFEADVKELGQVAEGIYASQVWLESSTFSVDLSHEFTTTRTPLQLGLIASGIDIISHLRGAIEKLVADKKPITGATIKEVLHRHVSHGLLGKLDLSGPPETSGERFVRVRDGGFELAPSPSPISPPSYRHTAPPIE